MQELYTAIFKSEQLAGNAQDLAGKSYGLLLGVVADVADPLNLGRIRVLLPSKGAKALTDWLLRLTLDSTLSVPIVRSGDTVVVGFLDGDPHNGVFLGVANNAVSPPSQLTDSHVVMLGDSQVIVSPDRIVLNVGKAQLVLTDGNLDINGVSSVTIQGKQVATVGAKDTHSDTLITKGWS